MSDNVVGISGASVSPVTGIVGATVSIGQYIINDYVITIAEIEGDYGYTMTITKGSEVQTVTLYGLTQAQYDDIIGYLEQAQAAAQSASSDASNAAASMRSASSSATVAIQSATRAETAENSAKNYQNNALSYSNTAKGYRDEAATQRSLAQAARTAAETAQGAAETAQSAAETAQAAAETAATNAGASATSAAGSAAAAYQSATDAAASAASAAQTLASVQAEGAAQIAAIDAEGQEVLESIPEDYSELSGDVADLKSQVTNRTAGVLSSDDESDLDITDPSGNVLVRLAGGEIETSKFNSATTVPKLIEEEGENETDLDIADIYGNVLGRFKGGNFETNKFKGFDYVTYKSQSVVYDGTLPLTLTVNHIFRKGDRVVLHVERSAKPWDYGAIVNYYIGDTCVLSEARGDNAWLEYVVMEDVDTISAVYTGNVSTTEMHNGDMFTLEASLMGDIPVEPTIITVKQDGSGDFTTIRGALDSIGLKANDVLNPYRVEVYPGTYSVMDDYTDEEIADAAYNITKCVGPVLFNGVTLVGMGVTPSETVLTATLDPEQWSQSIRNAISTLNCQGSCGFENVTLIAHNIRYCCHDDYTQPHIQRIKRLIRNVIFRGYDVAYTPCTTYGAGTRFSCGEYAFENCDFGENAGLHTSNAIFKPAKVHLINCCGHGFRIGDNVEGTVAGDESEYRFDNCDFLWINQNMIGDVPHVIVTGCGGASPLYQFDAQTLYSTGDVVIVPNDAKPVAYSGVGTVLEWYASNEHGPRFRPSTSVDTARGIVVWEDSENTYIQTKGYVRTDRTAISAFVLNDYIGMSGGVAAVVSSADQAFGRIVYIDNTGAGYIKLNWR